MKRFLFFILMTIGISITSFGQIYYEDINYDVQLGLGYSPSTREYTLSIVQYDKNNFKDFSFNIGNAFINFTKSEIVLYPDLDTHISEIQYVMNSFQHHQLLEMLNRNEYVYINGVRYTSIGILEVLNKIVNFVLFNNTVNINFNKVSLNRFMVIPRHPLFNGEWHSIPVPHRMEPKHYPNYNRPPFNNDFSNREPNRYAGMNNQEYHNNFNNGVRPNNNRGGRPNGRPNNNSQGRR